jgi:hypothetical protein
MNWRLITIVLACAAIGLGIWARHTAQQREFEIVFATSGDDALRWAESAKKDRWVEIVELEITDSGQVTHVAIPDDQLDEHLRKNDSVFVRRWLPNDAGAGITGLLAQGGYSDMTGMANKTAKAAAWQRIRTRLLALAAVIAGLAAVPSGVLAVRRSRSPTPSTPAQ